MEPGRCSLSARAGTTCEATFGSARRQPDLQSPVAGEIAFTRKNQSARRRYYIYTAPASTGSDAFTLRVCGSEDGKAGCATLEYAVTVN